MLTLTSLVVLGALASFPGDGSSEGKSKPVGQSTLQGISCGCSADFDHSGLVDGADLGHLLADWGASGSDLNGSGSTDGADLGILLGQWGPCSAVPSNDLCSNPLPIGVGTHTFCTSGAGTEVPPYEIGSPCNELGYDNVYADIWYLYVPSESGTLTVSTCGTSWDTRLAVYENFWGNNVGCPGGESNFNIVVACNDDFASCGLNSQVELAVTGGQQYLIRVGGFNGYSGVGTLTLDLHAAHQTCEDAIHIGYAIPFQPLEITDSTLECDAGTDVSPCGTGDTAAKWYRFAGECSLQTATYTITTCNPATDFDTVISVWKKGSNQCLGEFMQCNDDSPTAGCQIDGLNRRSRVQFSTGGAATFFYVRVSGYQGAKGNFELSVVMTCN